MGGRSALRRQSRTRREGNWIYTLSHLIDCAVDDLFFGGEGGVWRHAKEIRPRHFTILPFCDVIAGEGLPSPSSSFSFSPSSGQTTLCWPDIMGVSCSRPRFGFVLILTGMRPSLSMGSFFFLLYFFPFSLWCRGWALLTSKMGFSHSCISPEWK